MFHVPYSRSPQWVCGSIAPVAFWLQYVYINITSDPVPFIVILQHEERSCAVPQPPAIYRVFQTERLCVASAARWFSTCVMHRIVLSEWNIRHVRNGDGTLQFLCASVSKVTKPHLKFINNILQTLRRVGMLGHINAGTAGSHGLLWE